MVNFTEELLRPRCAQNLENSVEELGDFGVDEDPHPQALTNIQVIFEGILANGANEAVFKHIS